MAYLPKPQQCKNNCGAMIYFDKDSQVGHPEADKWIPLVYEKDTGVYTGEPHNCPKRPKYSNGSSNQQQQQPKSEYDESVDRGISAFTMMTDSIKLVEQTQKQG